jgi:outer membrane protein OmpA-like peptidoglycan-associated protein
MGGDSGETAQIDFAPGSAELSPAARERLDALAAKLTDRPGLKLEATGHADAQRDGAALQASTNRPAAAAAPTPARAGSAAAPTVPTANLAPALQALADRRADAVMAHLGATLPPERILITRSVVDATTAPAAADTAASSVGPGSTVQFKLR